MAVCLIACADPASIDAGPETTPLDGALPVEASLAECVAATDRVAAEAALERVLGESAVKQRDEWFSVYFAGTDDLDWLVSQLGSSNSLWESLEAWVSAHMAWVEGRSSWPPEYDTLLVEVVAAIGRLVRSEALPYREVAATSIPTLLHEIAVVWNLWEYYVTSGLDPGDLADETWVPAMFLRLATHEARRNPNAVMLGYEPLVLGLAETPSLLAVEALVRLTEAQTWLNEELKPEGCLDALIIEQGEVPQPGSFQFLWATTSRHGAEWSEWYERCRPFLYVEPGPRPDPREADEIADQPHMFEQRPKVTVQYEWMDAGAIPDVIPYGDPAYGSPSFPPSRFEDWDEHRDEYPYNTWYVWNKLDEPVRQGVLTLQVPQ